MNGRRGPSGAGFWIACMIGWCVIAFGIAGLYERLGTSGTVNVGLWVVGGNVVHDVVLAPLVLAVGAGLACVVRRPWRAPLAAGLVASAAVVGIAYPALRGFGRKPRNRTVLPLQYGTAVLTVLAVIWALVIVWLVLIEARRSTALRRRARRPGATSDATDAAHSWG
jgi:uncharacterized membrane protein